MISYRDKTFCNNTMCKKECSRKLTDEILKEAEKFGLPVALASYDCQEDEDANI